MAAQVIIDLRGLDETMRRLGQPEVIREAIVHSGLTSLQPVLEDSRARTPTRSGKLRRSQRLRVRQNIGQVEITLVSAPHGHLVHDGHEKIPRGPSRSGLGQRDADTPAQRQRRIELRRGLLARRSRGSLGFVKARPFATDAYKAREDVVRDVFEQSMFTILGLR